jgi:cytosine/adenosine deaminase-related metal-dependent hydrolase
MTGPKNSEAIHEVRSAQGEAGLSRRSLLIGAGLGTLGAATLLSGGPAPAQNATTGGEFVIRRGILLTVDPDLGNIGNGDIHVRDGVIVAIGKDLAVPAGIEEIDASKMIVMPGMIDTHNHLWTTLMRNFFTDSFNYNNAKPAVIDHLLPSDFYASNMLALAESLNTGVTTVHNFAHHIMSAETVEAELQAHADAGLRALMTPGRREGTPRDKMINLELIDEFRKDWLERRGPFEKLGQMLDYGINVRGPDVADEAVVNAEMQWAVEREMFIAMHGGTYQRGFSLVPLKERGYMSPKFLMVHHYLAEQEDRTAMAETGASLSFAALGGQGQYRSGMQLMLMQRDGVNTSLSVDTGSFAPIDAFLMMLTATKIGTPEAGSPTDGLPPVTDRDVVEMMTIRGAKALGMADRVGSLTVGKRADIIMIRADDLSVTPAPFGAIESVVARRARSVDTVIVDGRFMKRGGKIEGVDIGKVKDDVTRATHDLRARLGDKIPAPAADLTAYL